MADDIDIEDFVMNKGALSVMFELGVEDKSFNELKESPTILISPNTLSKRLKEAIRLGLVEKVVGEGEIRSTINYTLTDPGEEFLSQFDDIHNQYFDLKKEIAELKEQIDHKEKQIKRILSEEAGKQLEGKGSIPADPGAAEEPAGEPHEEADAASAEPDEGGEPESPEEATAGEAEQEPDTEPDQPADDTEPEQSEDETPDEPEPDTEAADEDQADEEEAQEQPEPEPEPETAAEAKDEPEPDEDEGSRKDEIERLREELNL